MSKHYAKCLKLYNDAGPSAVLKYGEKHKLKHAKCEPCEMMVPVEDGVCLVCGSSIKEVAK